MKRTITQCSYLSSNLNGAPFTYFSHAVSSRSTPEPNIVTTPDPDQPPSIRASPGHSGPVRASPVGSNTQFDKLVDPARYYKCRVKDEGNCVS